LEGLSDREAVGQLATNIAWKAATGLALTDEAFHSTVLVLWRNKLRASTSPQRIFDAVRAVVVESKVLEGKTRRALDSTVLDDAVARQDTVTMLVAQIRRVQRLIPELGSVWVREHNLQGGRPPCDWDDPDDRDRLVSELVDDANELVWAAETLELTEAQADAVALLALVAGQDVEPGDGPGQWRIHRRLRHHLPPAPAHDRTHHRLARQRQPPAPPLPGHPTQPPRLVASLRRGEPQTAPHARPHLGQLDPQLTLYPISDGLLTLRHESVVMYV
jgi:hypothetical protein